MRIRSALLCVLAAMLCLAPAAKGAASDPLYVFTPIPPPIPPIHPPPTGAFYGPCGLATDPISSPQGLLYVADYYHHTVDVFEPGASQQFLPHYIGQLTGVDPASGPCGLAIDESGHLYVTGYDQNVLRYGTLPSFGAGTPLPLPVEDTAHHLPTGVAIGPEDRVYVDHRSYVSVFDSSGAPVEVGGEPLLIGKGTLGEGYGVAVSRFPGTLGRVYVPDAQSDTVKVYDPAINPATPVATIKNPFGQPFVSLRESSIAVDRVSGEIYVAEDTMPGAAERPQATIQIYAPNNVYKGHLKHSVTTARPAGLAVDNSTGSTQGRVYVTSGNTTPASIYAYPPGAATNAAVLAPLSSGLTGREQREETSAPSPDAVATPSVISQKGNLRVSVESRLSPKRLPREGSAPIAVSVGWKIDTTDGTPAPTLKTLTIAINKEGRFDTQGLPTCPYAKIQPATTQRALSNCKQALVGRGTFSAEISLEGQEAESYEVTGQLLVFNGSQGKKSVLFGQIYAARPFATSFVIPFALSEKRGGDYGTTLEAKLPAALRSWGNLTGIQMRLSRRYGANGRRHSFISAGCPAPKGFSLASFKLARTSFDFTGGKTLSSTVEGDCRVRG
jgi:hypothetical protein